MYADFSLHTRLPARLAVLSLVAFLLAGCKTEKDPDDPTLLGAPPATAYLGVEYSYNWGAYGGESILEYSLSNGPSWLALEPISNEARQGIIMRGVPGLTGGRRGDLDLGPNNDIDIVTTDGRMAGFQPFDIEVKRNLLSLDVPEFTESESPEDPGERENQCALPDMGQAGSHSFELNLYDSEGRAAGTEPVTYVTTRGYVTVQLDQPSVTRVQVAFELRSDFDENACDEPTQFAGDQGCDHGQDNLGEVRLGQDVIIRGSGSDAAKDDQGNRLDYIDYIESGGGPVLAGLITFEPGITECYIPLEIVNDRIPEPAEFGRIHLTEVVNGIAALGSSDTGVDAVFSIDDDEPVVSVATSLQGPRDTINIGAGGIYTARLTGERDADVRVRLTSDILPAVRDYQITQVAPATTELDADQLSGELLFPAGIDTVEFRVDVTENSAAGTQDRAVQFKVDQKYQAGRQNYARGESDNLLRVNVNRLIRPLGWNDGFTATDLATGHEGRLFIAGYTSTNQPGVKVCNQQAAPECVDIEISGEVLAGSPEVYVATAERSVTEDRERRTYYEMAVAFSTSQGAGGQSGSDIVLGLYQYNSDTDNYALRWTDLFPIGTAQDEQVRWLGLNESNGYIAVAGETSGTWPEQTSNGANDVFLARVDTVPDGANEVPVLTWARQFGSVDNDRVIGGSVELSTPMLFGQADTTLDGTASTGPFFVNGNDPDQFSAVQVGQESHEIARRGFFDSGKAWFIGDSTFEYALIEVEGEDGVLDRTPLNSRSGFALGFGLSGTPATALTANDQNDLADVVLARGLIFDDDILVAGEVDGEFQSGHQASGTSAVLARLSLGGDKPYRNWRRQLQTHRFLKLANYRNDKLVVLAEHRNNGLREILLFSPEGELLTVDQD